MSTPARIALIGFRFGYWHARTLVAMPEARVAAIADRNPPDRAGMESYARSIGAAVYADAVEMLERERPDGVSLCTSPRGRRDVLAACARLKIPVYVEKPWAASMVQARELAAIAAPIADRVMLGFNFRLLPAVERASQLVRDTLGPVWMANGEYAFEWALPVDFWLWDPAIGGGVFTENSCHLLDLLCHFAGEPVAISAETANPRGAPGDEIAAITLRFAHGAIAAVTLGAISAKAMTRNKRLELVTAKGRLHLEAHDHCWDRVTWMERDGEAIHEQHLAPEAMADTRYAHAFRRFISGIRDGSPFPTTIADGMRCVAIAEALKESAATGRRVAITAPT